MIKRPVILGYLWRAPIMLAGQIAAYPLAPVGAFLCDADGRLPKLLQWLETHDQPGWKGPASIPALAALITGRDWGWKQPWALTRWLWRNKAYRLAGALGIKPERDEVAYINSGGSLVPPKWGPSLWWGVLTCGGRTYWELQPRISAFGRVAYLRIGWKIIGYCRSVKEARRWPDASGQDGMFNAVSPRLKSLSNW